VIVHTEPVMGTMVSFHGEPGGLSDDNARAAVASACARLHELEDIFSTWKPTSAMSRFRAGSLRLEDAPVEMALVLELCEKARRLSQGWFDPWAMPGGFDPTGLVKGWATEQALGRLRLAGVRAAIVNGGGDIAVYGLPEVGSWRVGVRHPWRADGLACVLGVDRAIATSGCYERGPHLINPKDGRMVFRTASATVVGEDLSLCDALATALVVADGDGPELARSLDGYESYIIQSDGTEFATEGIVFATETETATGSNACVPSRL
jgi:thiamine biosynthesis lipoprotein